MAGKSVRIENAPWGMGDAIWLLPALRALHEEYAEVYLPTPWPEMFWGLPWVCPLRPAGDSPYASWPLFKRALAALPPRAWFDEPPPDAEVVTVCQTGDNSTRFRAFYSFGDAADMRFPLKSAWKGDAAQWLEHAVPREWPPKPRVLLHLPTQVPGEPPQGRYCQPRLFQDLYDRFRDRVHFFDCQQNLRAGESEVVLDLPIPTRRAVSAPALWALTRVADAVITTDNHGLPLAIAQERRTLYLAGDVPVDYLLDPRIDRSRIEVVPNGCEDAGLAFERLLETL